VFQDHNQRLGLTTNKLWCWCSNDKSVLRDLADGRAAPSLFRASPSSSAHTSGRQSHTRLLK
jgi:hypothetical protein